MKDSDEIKVGEYVRTYEGYIAKFIHYGKNEGIAGKSCLFDHQIRDISGYDLDDDNFLWDDEMKSYIKSHSFNKIDLIEAGDYVNGICVFMVGGISKNGDKCVLTEIGHTLCEKDINTILTRNLFASNIYDFWKGETNERSE